MRSAYEASLRRFETTGVFSRTSRLECGLVRPRRRRPERCLSTCRVPCRLFTKALSQQPEHSPLNINLKLKTQQPVPPMPSDAGRESSRDQPWPPIELWARRQEALVAKSFRRLGVGPERDPTSGIWASQVLDVLGPGSFAQFEVIRSPGRVLWCNFDLARQLGFEVPRINQLSPEFHDQLLAALSFRAVAHQEEVSGQETVTMYADKYGGDGVLPALGAGRAGFLSQGNLYVKGMGFTPLFKHNDPDDFAHSHGAVHLDDCLSEVVFGEVNENLFARGSSRVLAVIDQDKEVVAPTGQRIPVALVVRAGSQLRPAHLLASHIWPRRSKLARFVSMAHATGQLVTRQDKQQGGETPDLHATMLRIIDDHAGTTAEGFRWRMIHGALSASNMELSAAMLDLPTQSAQPRTAPIRALDYADSAFGSEHVERAARLTTMYRALVKSIPAGERGALNVRPLDIAAEMRTAYERHLQIKLLSAVGLKTELAQRLQAEAKGLATRFTNLILEMIALRNPGTTRTSRSVVEMVSVLDVFHLLQKFPQEYFAKPNCDHARNIRDYLRPVLRCNRFHIAKKQSIVNELTKKFANLYAELMNACAGYAAEYYGDAQSMQSSITARAAFENEPLGFLYSRKLLDDLRKTIVEYRSTGNPKIIREAIDERIVASLRNVDGLLAQGNSRRLIGGGVELQMRTIQGARYSVRAWNDEKQTRRLHVSIPIEVQGNQFLTGITNLPRLTKRQIPSLRYRFTTDGSRSFAEVKGRLTRSVREGLCIEFDDILNCPLIGRLEGSFHLGIKNSHLADRMRYFAGYTFAIPDQKELISLVAEPAGN